MIVGMNTRTTVSLPDELVRELERRAAEQGEPLAAVVEETLRRGLAALKAARAVPPLPTYAMGVPKLDLANRDELYRTLTEQG